MSFYCARLDEDVSELADFKRRHEQCVELNYGHLPSVDPRLLFSYSCADSPLGAIVSVECRCGARWTWFDGESHEEPARRERGAGCEIADAEALKAILSAARRPKMYFGPPYDSLWPRFQAFERGVGAGIRIARGGEDGPYTEVMRRLDTRLRENELAGAPSPGNIHGKLLEQADGDLERIAIWASELRLCIREEFPKIAGRIDGLLLEDEERPLGEMC